MMTLSLILASLGILVLMIAALGVWRLPDALSRQHAATKAATIAIGLVASGLMLYASWSGWDAGWLWRLSALLLSLLVTLPLASHGLARAGLWEAQRGKQ
jgi:multicomponent Na+:H+ antiporter subunit G